ncbi:MAG: hypothetical protein E3K37_12270 [Candidatus Kuenenia sp.]|nr:hypothetical protein [Candidatus Kuenenia hertensis]
MLQRGEYSQFKIAVAYAKNSGISRIYNDLLNFANNGGKTSAIIGIDQNNTSYQALINLKTFTKDNLYIHHDRNFDITFHPKVYLFGNQEIEKVIVGSSNLTAGGFYLNVEANVRIVLDNSFEAKDFKNQVAYYWDTLINDENTKQGDLVFLNKLLELGALIDENRQKPFREIIEKIFNLPFKAKAKLKTLPSVSTQTITASPSLKENFAMTLSGFDVSARSQDPVILIPIAALKKYPNFWNWPTYYANSGAGYPQLYATANIKIDRNTFKDQHIRLYYYDSKREFRLQSEAIKRNGNPGDIITVHKDDNKPLEFDIELLRQGSTKHNNVQPLLNNKVSAQKVFTYY